MEAHKREGTLAITLLEKRWFYTGPDASANVASNHLSTEPLILSLHTYFVYVCIYIHTYTKCFFEKLSAWCAINPWQILIVIMTLMGT